MKTLPKFRSTLNRGFQITFQNGLTISVQWGTVNECGRRDFNKKLEDDLKYPDTVSYTAEIAIWDENGNEIQFENGPVKGYCTPSEVAEYITMVSEIQVARGYESDVIKMLQNKINR